MAQNQTTPQTILTPQEVFVGDRAQLRFSFKSTASFPSQEPSLTLEEADPRLPQSPECTVVGLSLSKTADGEYNAVITFIPWKTGLLTIPPITLESGDTVFVVTAPQPLIRSLTEKTQSTALKPPAPPKLIPGTTYVVYGIVLGAVLSLILLITVLVKIQAVSKGLSGFFERLKLSRNYKRLKRRLRKLEKRQETYNPEEFAEQLEKTLRTYFYGKYLVSFASLTARECLSQLTSSGSPRTAAEPLATLFSRCDFVRYCAPDEKKLEKEERLELLQMASTVAAECEHAPL